MKTKILLLFFFIMVSIQAQVTIGSSLPPSTGAILDLKEKVTTGQEANSTRGLLLPRVMLTTSIDLAPTVVGASDIEKTKHAGLTVYHIGNANLCAGTYFWDATRWNRLPAECKINLKCETVLVNGTYTRTVALNSTNTITLQLDVPSASAGGTYQISTDAQNGMSFAKTGTLVKGIMNIVLNGSGTPTAANVTSIFTISATFSNSSATKTCTTDITTDDTFSFGKLNVLGVGYDNAHYGFFLNRSASRALVTSANNFGQQANSVVKTDGFNISIINEDLLFSNDLTTPIKNADIIVNGYFSHIEEAYSGSKAVTDALVQHLKDGKVIILCDEYKGSYSIAARICRQLFPANAANITGVPSDYAGTVQTILSSVPAGDPILDGPFSVNNWTSKTPIDLRGRLWGNDASDAMEISGLPEDKIIIYSRGRNGAPTMFKLKDYNLFFVGDGGFLSNNSAYSLNNPSYPNFYAGNSYYDGCCCPFAVDSSCRPISRINFGSLGGANRDKEIFNSQLFANVMAWAVAEVNKLK